MAKKGKLKNKLIIVKAVWYDPSERYLMIFDGGSPRIDFIVGTQPSNPIDHSYFEAASRGLILDRDTNEVIAYKDFRFILKYYANPSLFLNAERYSISKSFEKEEFATDGETLLGE
jgi:hypothetical protein